MEAEETEPRQADTMTEPPASVMSVLEGDPSSQVSTEDATSAKQPRTLASIDDILVSRTQPAPEEELEDVFDYTRGGEEDLMIAEGEEAAVQAGGTAGDESAIPSAQDSVQDMASALDEDKENSVNTDNQSDTFVRQAVSQLPISKIKRIMKMDPDTKLIQNESVLLVAFATELFIKALSTSAARWVTLSLAGDILGDI